MHTAARPARSWAVRPCRRESRRSVPASRLRALQRSPFRPRRSGTGCPAGPGIPARAARSRAPRTQARDARGSGAAARSDRSIQRSAAGSTLCSRFFADAMDASVGCENVEYHVRAGNPAAAIRERRCVSAKRLKQRLRNGEKVLGCWSMLGQPAGRGDPEPRRLRLSRARPGARPGRCDEPCRATPRHVRDADGRRRARAVERPRVPEARARRRRRGRAHPQHRHRRRRARRGRRLPLSAARPARHGRELGARVELRHGRRLCRRPVPTTSSSRARSSRPGPWRTSTRSWPSRASTCMFIGPFDLSATVGQMGNLKHPEVARADRARRDERSARRAVRWAPCRIPAARGRTCSSVATSS